MIVKHLIFNKQNLTFIRPATDPNSNTIMESSWISSSSSQTTIYRLYNMLIRIILFDWTQQQNSADWPSSISRPIFIVKI